MVRDGTLRSPTRCVYVLDGTPDSFEQKVAIACATSPLVVASHRTTGRLRGLRKLGTFGEIEVTVPESTSLRLENVVVHRTKLMPAEHIEERTDGIRLTTLRRTIFDLCAVLDDSAIESIVEQALDKFGVRVDELYALGDQLRRSGRNGSQRYARVLASRPAFRRPAGSDHEVRLLQELRRLGLPDALRQATIEIPDDAPLHPDLYWPDLGLAVEVDHSWWHAGRRQSQYDKGRDRKLARLGIQVLRVTEEDIERRLGPTGRDVAAVVAHRRSLSA